MLHLNLSTSACIYVAPLVLSQVAELIKNSFNILITDLVIWLSKNAKHFPIVNNH